MQDLSNDQKIKHLRELAAIFRDLKKHADEGTYKDDAAGAWKLIIDGLDKGAQALKVLNDLRSEYGLCPEYPELNYSSGDIPLNFIEEKRAGKMSDEMQFNVESLVKEITGQLSYDCIWDYLALANDLDRWADNISKNKSKRQPKGGLKKSFLSIIERNRELNLTREELAKLCDTTPNTLSQLPEYKEWSRKRKRN